MPTEKRARQKAARQAKRAAQLRRAKLRRRLRSSAFIVGGAAVVLVVVLATTGAFSSSPSTPSTSGSTTTTTQATLTVEQTQANAAAAKAGCKASTTARVNTLQWPSPPAMTIDTAKTYTATVVTTAGSFTIDLLAKTAPNTVNNFVFLAGQGYFHCVIFQRVIPGFMDQTGDPTGTGSGTPGYSFANENVPKSYATGDVAMANSGGTDTNGSQFFIVVPGGAKALDQDLAKGTGYSLFGKVTAGLSVVEKINGEGTATGKPSVVQRILSVTIHTH